MAPWAQRSWYLQRENRVTVDTVRVTMIAVDTTQLYPLYENRVTVDIIRVIAVIAVGTAQLGISPYFKLWRLFEV